MMPTAPNAPSAYLDGYTRARAFDQDGADNYLRHTTIGDPELDPVMEELAGLPPADMHRFIAAGINAQAEVLCDAPRALRDFFEGIHGDPAWVDHESFEPGVRAFHANAISIFGAFVAGTLIEGFATLISQSFFMTGRVIDKGVRRLRQNNRHQVEIFFPEGLRRENDGWKLSVRTRFVHAQVRRLLAHSGFCVTHRGRFGTSSREFTMTPPGSTTRASSPGFEPSTQTPSRSSAPSWPAP